MRGVLAIVVGLAGCSFEARVADDLDPDAPDEPPPPPPPSSCDLGDPELRLCIEFEDPAMVPTVRDGSSYELHAATAEITKVRRGDEGAAHVGPGSMIHVPESAALDPTGAITFELWLNPDHLPITGLAVALDNHAQWAAGLRANGMARCWFGAMTVDGGNVEPGRWTHLACVYDGERWRLHVDGTGVQCRDAPTQLSTGGTLGLAIGSDLQPGPSFELPITGGVDDVRVYGRALSQEELCDHAELTGPARAQCASQRACGPPMPPMPPMPER